MESSSQRVMAEIGDADADVVVGLFVSVHAVLKLVPVCSSAKHT